MAIQDRLPGCPDPRFLNIFGSSLKEFSYEKRLSDLKVNEL